MTDNEIIKALECFAIDKDFDEHQCKGCAFETKGLCCENASEGVARASLDLINRQKTEIERLQKIIVGFMDEVGTWSNKYEVDISTIHKLPLLAKEDFNIRNKITAEAIKKFAHQLKILLETKAKLYSLSDKDCEFAIVQSTALKTVDNLVKEMTEQRKEDESNG